MFNNTASSGATVSNLSPGSTYAFQWKITNGGCSTTSNDTLRILQPPTTATTSGDQTLSTATTATIQGNIPVVGTGSWSQISGPAATINSPSSAGATVSGLTSGNSYGFLWTISNGICTPSSSSLLITKAIPLPIKFLSFTATRVDETAVLEWVTADEQSTDYFEAERSTDGIHFTGIATIAAKKAEGGSYQYIDPFPATPAEEARLYRIRENGYSGARRYSAIVALNAPVSSGIQVQPNPFSSGLSLSFYEKDERRIIVKLSDITGRVMIDQPYTTAKGTNSIALTGLDPLPSGMYLLTIQAAENCLLIKKVIKQ